MAVDAEPFVGKRSVAVSRHLWPLGNFMGGNGALARAVEPINLFGPQFAKLGFAAIHTRTPQPPTAAFEVLAHEFYHVVFGEAKLRFDGFKGRAVFPGHLNDAVDVFGRKHTLKNSWGPALFHEHARGKKGRPARENLRGVRAAVCVAEEMGESVG